jgi:hypothetical protein
VGNKLKLKLILKIKNTIWFLLIIAGSPGCRPLEEKDCAREHRSTLERIHTHMKSLYATILHYTPH